MPKRAWTKSQLVAIASGGAVAFLLALVATAVLTWTVQRRAEAEKLTSVHFDGSNLVQIENDPQLQFGPGPFTVSFWFKTTAQAKNQTLLSKRVSTMGNGWVISALEDNRFLLYSAGCASPASGPQQFRDGRWHHLAFVRSGQVMTIFFDNVSVGSGPNTCNYKDRNPIRIGMDAQKGWPFEGDIAELHIYGRALNPSEIGDEWNNGRGRKSAVAAGGLIAGFHLDEAAGAAMDFSGQGHRGAVIRNPAEAAPN
jgi:hypothetical protein